MTQRSPLAELALADQTVGNVLAARAKELGDKVYIRDVGGETITYAELHRTANRLAHGLAALGVDHQEPVLTLLPSNLDFVRIWVGLARRGAIEVPVNTAYRGPILRHICNDSTARTIVVDAQFLERLEDIADELEHVERCILYTEDPQERASLTLPPKLAARCETLHFDALFADSAEPFEDTAAFHDLHAIMYTSGTTGPSKGAMTPHAHAFSYASATIGLFDVQPEDVLYNAGLPLFHVAGKIGMNFTTLLAGASVVLRGTFKSDAFWSDIEEHRCTITLLLGAVANFLWQQPPTQNDAQTPLRVTAMVPAIPEYEGFAKRFGLKIATGYGASESPLPIIHASAEPLPSYRCIGRAREGFEVKIVDAVDCELPSGEVGEIVIRPTLPWSMTQGYWKRPEATSKAFRNLWFHTGDAGYADAEGQLYFVDRLTDSMRRRGENISSMEVEDQINQHEDVLESAVFGVWDEHTEQEVMAVVTPLPGRSIDPADLTAFVNHRLPYFMVPRYLEFTSELPKTPTGKIQKFELRKRGVTPATWDRVEAGVKLER